MNVAVIGAGYWGVNLVRVFRQLGVLRWVCDFSAHRLEASQRSLSMNGEPVQLQPNHALEAVDA